ncbi:MAG TPA: glycosyltransferase family 2 protein, partial [Burkholderiaceae bacterium]
LEELGPQGLFIIGQHDFTIGLSDLALYCNVTRTGSVFYIDQELSYFRCDPRLQSNSNVAANPDFGYCFSDYFDHSIEAHRTGVITAGELLAITPKMTRTARDYGRYFKQMAPAEQRFLSYSSTLVAAA